VVPYQSSAGYLAAFYGRLLPATFHHRPSMLADLQHRGRTEIGALNGALVAMADRRASARDESHFWSPR
jgi:ketopantoate reductase